MNWRTFTDVLNNSEIVSCTMRNRDYSLDLIRVIACLMIVLMHSPMSGLGTSGFVLCGVSYFTAPGIGLFFMISGALLLKGNGGRPFETRYFLRRRFTKILVPLVFWTLVGWGLEQCGVKNTEQGILWFMYCLAGIYLLTPILSRWLVLAKVKEIEFYLLLWLMTLCVPFVELFTPVNESDTSWLYYFHGYVGYYVLGFYLQNYKGKGWLWTNIGKVMWGIVLVLFSIVLPLALFILQIEVDFYRVCWYLSITVALQCVAWWSLVKRMMKAATQLPVWVGVLSNLCFGIYLVHILVMRNFLWEMEWMMNMNGIVQIVVCTILTFLISAAASWGISKIPYVRKVIGC